MASAANGPAAPAITCRRVGLMLPPIARYELRRCGDHRILVTARAYDTVSEDAMVGDPLEHLLINLLCVGLEHEALARTPAARVHHGVVTRRKFLRVVVGVQIGPQIDVALRALERAEELAQVFGVR